MRFTKGNQYYANYYQSDMQTENGQPKYLIIHSSLYNETDNKGKEYWIAFKYHYTLDVEAHTLTGLLQGYTNIWDGFKTAKQAKEYCLECEEGVL